MGHSSSSSTNFDKAFTNYDGYVYIFCASIGVVHVHRLVYLLFTLIAVASRVLPVSGLRDDVSCVACVR